MTWVRDPTERLFEAGLQAPVGAVAFRVEEPGDAAQIRDLLEKSFGGAGEALLVERLRSDGDMVIALVAEDMGVVVGYVAFSRLRIEAPNLDEPFPAVALAPLAVYPEYQQEGIATQLVREAHACLAALGETLSLVLGEPGYYGRFGYHNRRAAHFSSVYQSPYLMALSFGSAPSEGRLIYPAAFDLLSDDAALQADHRV